MSFFNVIQLAGGLALFLYGMSVMSNGLERVSGGRLEQTLERLTSNLFKSIMLGALVTAAIQSSSATTVIVVGLVNAHILQLRQAIGIIMGANIGTTITAHIIRLSDIDATGNVLLGFLKPTTLAPLAAIIGIVLYHVSKKARKRDLGLILIGFGILFTGMFGMEAAVAPLQDSPVFIQLFSSLSNPILGVLVGTVVTMIIQSSSASIGILQALTVTGAISTSAAYPIILGQNIGTCVTPVLASIGASKNARRTAFVHVSFNILGTVLFLVLLYTVQYTIGFPHWDDPITKGGIANFHTVFNILTTILFAPFVAQLERMAKFFIKTSNDEIADETSILDERFLGSPAFAISHARDAVVRMAELSLENFCRAVTLIHQFDSKKLERAKEVEDVIDRLQSKVDNYLLKLSKRDLTESETTALSEVLQVVNEFERIGDHADNLCDCAVDMQEHDIRFSGEAMNEFFVLTDATQEVLEMAVNGYIQQDTQMAHSIEPLEEVIDMMVETLKVYHSDRLRQDVCSVDAAIHFVDILYNFERIADHCSNVGVHIISYSGSDEVKDRHEFLREMRRNKSQDYKDKMDMYDQKYFGRITQ